jgi:Immunity protein 35
MVIGEARALAQRHLDASGVTEQGQRLVVFPEDELVDDFAWCYVFHYNAERYIETNDPDDAMGPGAGLIAIVKEDGAIYEMGSAPGDEDSLADYGRTHGYL